VGLPATAMQRKASAATRNRPVAVFGRCERWQSKSKWVLELIGPCANLELQFSLVSQAHQQRSGRICNTSVRMRFDWGDTLKQLLLLRFVLEPTMEHGGSPNQIQDIFVVFDSLVRRGLFRF